MLIKPHDAVACNGVHPSLSPLSMSAPCLTKNSTMSRLSSMQAWKITNSRAIERHELRNLQICENNFVGRREYRSSKNRLFQFFLKRKKSNFQWENFQLSFEAFFSRFILYCASKFNSKLLPSRNNYWKFDFRPLFKDCQNYTASTGNSSSDQSALTSCDTYRIRCLFQKNSFTNNQQSIDV